MANKLDEKTIYEIFRACRLCGAGGGYKMPIIPSVVGFDCAEIELRQKIRDCLQIECNQDDKMPPLICELCVDKVNDFYEFMEMCRQTNVRTRQRLGLPPMVSRTSSEDDCILGVTEALCFESDDEPLTSTAAGSKPKPGGTSKPGPKSAKAMNKKKNEEKVKRLQKELDDIVQHDSMSSSKREARWASRESRDSASSGRRNTRAAASTSTDNSEPDHGSLTRIQKQPKPNLKREVESPILIEDDDDCLQTLRSKKQRLDRIYPEKETIKESPTENKLKLKIKLDNPPTVTPKAKPGPKSRKPQSPVKIETKPTKPEPKPTKPDPKPIKSDPKFQKPELRLQKPDPKLQKPDPKLQKPDPKLQKPDQKLQKPNQKLQKPDPKSQKPDTKSTSRPGPKSSKRAASPPPSRAKPGPKSKAAPPKPSFYCNICEQEFQSQQGLSNHMRLHLVKFTSPELACNPCGEWFRTADETAAHHKWHKYIDIPYACRACPNQYRQHKAYLQHMAENPNHSPWKEVPAVRCPSCWKEFVTRPVLAAHRCAGEDARPGGKCSKCKKYYHTLKNLKKHESACSGRKKGYTLSELKVDPAVRKRLLPMKVKIARCDPLLGKRRRCDAAKVPPDYGLDRSSVYPYRSLVRIKREPLDVNGMVVINKDVRDEFYKEEDYVHWDSDASTDSEEEYSLVDPTKRVKKLPSLTALALKTIFSKRCIGKVPRKLRKVKNDKFDSLFQTEQDFDVQNDINNIINNLGADNDNEDDNVIDNIVADAAKDVGNSRISALINEETAVSYDSDSLLDSTNIEIKVHNSYNNVGSDSLLDQNKATDSDNIDFDSLLNDNKIEDKNGNSNLESDSLLDSNTNLAKDSEEAETNSTDLLENIDRTFQDKTDSQTDASSIGTNKSQNDENDKISLDEILESTEPIKETIAMESKDISENCLNFDNNVNSDQQNGVSLKVNGSDHSNDLISEINELYDRKLMDEFNVQMGL